MQELVREYTAKLESVIAKPVDDLVLPDMPIQLRSGGRAGDRPVTMVEGSRLSIGADLAATSVSGGLAAGSGSSGRLYSSSEGLASDDGDVRGLVYNAAGASTVALIVVGVSISIAEVAVIAIAADARRAQTPSTNRSAARARD